MFLLTLPAGDITDRFNQRRVYSLAAGLQALLQRPVPGAVSIFTPHTAWLFYAVLVLFGAARGFAGPSGSSLLPFLVPPERLPSSMAFSSSFFTARGDLRSGAGRLSLCAGAGLCLFASASRALSARR